MKKESGRTLSPQAQYERRKQAVRLYNLGKSYAEVATLLSMGEVTVRQSVKAFQKDGLNGLKPKVRGRRIGGSRKLSDEQAEQIKKMICDKRPDQLKLDFALWTRMAVLLLIKQEFNITMPIRSVGEYLKRWGFTPQRPVVRAYEQSSEAVKEWLEVEYPKIKDLAKQENAEIQWGDETAVVNTDVRGRGYQPKGQTPVRYASGGARQKLSMISTVTNQGKVRWMIIDDSFNADNLIVFLELLIKDASQKVFLILDNLRAHHSKKVKAWEAEHAEKIKLFYLPSYSPQLNPDERLNADLKYGIGSKVAVRTKEKLKEATENHMSMLEKSPERVMSYFDDEYIKYAA